MNQLPQIGRRKKKTRLFKSKKEKTYYVEYHFIGENCYQITLLTKAELEAMENNSMVEIVRVSRA